MWKLFSFWEAAELENKQKPCNSVKLFLFFTGHRSLAALPLRRRARGGGEGGGSAQDPPAHPTVPHAGPTVPPARPAVPLKPMAACSSSSPTAPSPLAAAIATGPGRASSATAPAPRPCAPRPPGGAVGRRAPPGARRPVPARVRAAEAGTRVAAARVGPAAARGGRDTGERSLHVPSRVPSASPARSRDCVSFSTSSALDAKRGGGSWAGTCGAAPQS